MAPPSVILASAVVHDLCQGKSLEFARHSDIEIAGDSVRLYELRSRTPSALAPRTSFPDGLTHREIEVLRLIAAGKTNQHIAGELVISLNTVARHVANILDKTGSENRTESAAYAYRERLV
jgi:DNA-binding NarL/FixJ family response regulator